jgi:hypothetical protein
VCFFRHVLRNALIPILTGVVVVIPLLFMGSLLTESFFGIPGLGSYTIDAINAQDFAVVRAMVFIGSVLYIVGLILTDISYTLVDPRIASNDGLSDRRALVGCADLAAGGGRYRLGVLIACAIRRCARPGGGSVPAGRAWPRRRCCSPSRWSVCSIRCITACSSSKGKPGQPASYAVEVLSVLDALLTPLRTRNEKTYSEPWRRVPTPRKRSSPAGHGARCAIIRA